MPKLHELVALSSGRKADVTRKVTDAYHLLDKDALFDGLSRSYRPIEDAGEKLPGDVKMPQQSVRALVADSTNKWRELFDVTASLDVGNQKAVGDVEIDGKVIMSGLPVPTLLFLEKQLADIVAYVTRLPTPDPAVSWSWDANQNMLVTQPVETERSKKTKKVIVKYDATKEHPAQTELIDEEKVTGYWTQIKYTTRIPVATKAAMLERASRLLDAVKVARERANTIEVGRVKMGDAALGYVFGDLMAK